MMALASSTTSVNVSSDTDLVESVPTAHVDVDAAQFEKAADDFGADCGSE